VSKQWIGEFGQAYLRQNSLKASPLKVRAEARPIISVNAERDRPNIELERLKPPPAFTRADDFNWNILI